MEIEVVGVLLDAFFDKALGFFVLLEFDEGTEEHLVIKLVGRTRVEGFVALGSLFELTAGIIVRGQLFLRLLCTAGSEGTEHEGQA